MNKLLLGRYVPGQSLLHRLDARAKLIAGFSFIFILFIAVNWQAYVFLWVFTFFIMSLTGISFRTFVRGVKPLIWLILFTVCLQILFTSGGTSYFEWGPINISEFGLMNGFFIFSRFVMLVLVSTAITLTTQPIDMADAIRRLLKPLRAIHVPVEDITIMMTIALRFIPNIFDETQKIIDAQKARGATIGEGNVFQQMKALVPIFLPLFVSTLNRAEETAKALEVKGYHSQSERSSFRESRWKARDTWCLISMGLVAGILTLFHHYF
jgi:Cobalt transport protein.